MTSKTTPSAPTSAASPCLRYRDTRYASRTLILPSGRSLPVVRHEVTAAVDDAEAQAYLASHSDLIPQE